MCGMPRKNLFGPDPVSLFAALTLATVTWLRIKRNIQLRSFIRNQYVAALVIFPQSVTKPKMITQRSSVATILLDVTIWPLAWHSRYCLRALATFFPPNLAGFLCLVIY